LLSGGVLTPALHDEYPRLIRDLSALGYQIALDTKLAAAELGAPDCAPRLPPGLRQCEHVLLNELEVASLV